MLNKLIYLGINENHTFSEVKRIKLLNEIVLLFSALVFLKMLHEMSALDIIGSSVTFFMFLTFISTLVFHYFKKIIFARIYFISILAIVLAVLNMLFGRGFGGEFCFFPVIITIIIFFDTLKTRLIWLGFFLFCYSISLIFLSYNEPIFIDNLSPSTFYFLFIACLAAVFWTASFFMRENNTYEIRMKELLEKLEIKNEGLEMANKELEKFAYVASHDLKTPLRNINSFLNLIQRKLNKGQTEEIPEFLEFATLNAKRMYSLIEDILEFSRFSNGEFSFVNEDLNEAVYTAISNIEEVINTKNAEVNCTHLPMIYCNKTQMTSLFQNLIENGLKYNKSTSPTINITCEDKGNMYEILIADNGIGIEKAYQDKIFEMFYRLHNQGEYEGSGIGLSTCKKIVTYHGGEIFIQSEQNKGTTFHIILPKVSQDATLVNMN